MLFESQWPGDAIAAPFCPEHDRADALFEDLGSKSSSLIDSLPDQTDADLRLPQCAVHPEFLLAPAEQGHCRDLGKDRLDSAGSDIVPTYFAVWRGWISSVASTVAELRSKMHRDREIRRTSAAWETIDDRTLKDIGVSRYEIEYTADARFAADVS
jgi:uncharacterized protein YjiS (DUF1127 family)